MEEKKWFYRVCRRCSNRYKTIHPYAQFCHKCVKSLKWINKKDDFENVEVEDIPEQAEEVAI